MGSLRGACLHIPRGREGVREKRATARWGVCNATTGASPRNPQLAIFQTKPNFKPLQIDIFVELLLKIGTPLPERQLVMHSILSHFRLNAECSRTFPPNLPSSVPSDNSRRPCILPDTNPLPSFRVLQDVTIFAGNTYKHRKRNNRRLWQIIPVPPI